VHGLGVLVVGVTQLQLDLSGAEEARDPVVARPAVDEAQVVVPGERAVVLIGAFGTGDEELVEERLPGARVDGRGVGHHPVEVEDHGGHRRTRGPRRRP
jgi:hypothetical protein